MLVGNIFRWRILCLCLITFCIQLLLFHLQTSRKLMRLQCQDEELSAEVKVMSGHSGPFEHKTDQLVDFYNFTFTLNAYVCENVKELLIIAVVQSALNNSHKRETLRKTWGQPTDYLKLVFMMGESRDKDLQETIVKEHIKYGDIVQGNFLDDYRNMTYKHVMALKWAGDYCPVANFVMKTDDDVFVHRHKLKDFAKSRLGTADHLISCFVSVKAKVNRDVSLKWFASEAEFTGEYYPPYCLGPFIFYRTDVAARLVEAAKSEPYFYIDDVFVTGILTKKLNISLTGISKLYMNNVKLSTLIHNGTFEVDKFLIGPLGLHPNNLMILWNITEQYRKLQESVVDAMRLYITEANLLEYVFVGI